MTDLAWVIIIIVILYTPIFYRIHKRLRHLEDAVAELRRQLHK